MAADWPAIRLEYVHSAVTLRELASKHGIKAAGVMRRAAKEGWESQRKQKSAEVSMAASEVLTNIRAADLAEYNAEDLAAAKRIRSKALEMLETAQTPHDLKAVSGAVDTASKVARLALGVATENSTVSTRELPGSVEEFV